MGSVDSAHQASAKRIGIVSALGDEAHGQLAGLPAVLLARRYNASSPDFGVDAAVSATAIQSVQAGNRGAQVVSLQSERGSVRLPEKPALSDLMSLTSHREEVLAEQAHRLASKYKLDLVVMVTPMPVRREGSTAQAPSEPGYGLWSVSLFGAHVGGVSVFANYDVTVFDGATGKRLAFRLGILQRMVEDVPWRSSLDAYSPAEREKIAGTIRALITEEIPKQLHGTGLAP